MQAFCDVLLDGFLCKENAAVGYILNIRNLSAESCGIQRGDADTQDLGGIFSANHFFHNFQHLSFPDVLMPVGKAVPMFGHVYIILAEQRFPLAVINPLYLPRTPNGGNNTGRPGRAVISPWGRCHLAGVHHRDSPKSSGEREQVSLSLTGSRHTRFYRSGLQSLRGSLGSQGSSWRRIFWCCFVSVCSCATVYSDFKIHRRTIGCPFK